MKSNFAKIILAICSLAIVLFSTKPQALYAQNQDFPTGLIFDDETYSAVPRLNYQMQFTSKKKARNYLKCPTPLSQGKIGSCVGHAFSNALTIMRAEKQEITEAAQMDKMRHSPLYIYNQIKVSEEVECRSGSRMEDALDLLLKKGDCLLKDFEPANCHPQPNAAQDQLAWRYRIKDAGTLFGVNAHADSKIETTINALSQGYPVIIGMKVTPSFVSLTEEKWTAPGIEPSLGGHAMVVVGYDSMRKVFRIMNSWGTVWGKGGFCTVGFDDYAKYVKYGYQILLSKRDKPEEEPVELAGTFEFLQYDNYDEGNEQYIFKKRSPDLKSTYYTLGGIEKDTWFRINAKNMTKGSYVYVFSLKPNKEVEILYPSDKSFVFSQSPEYIDGTKRGKIPKNQKPIVISEDVELMIPEVKDGDEGLTTDMRGTDYLCILYSDKEIGNIKKLVKKVQKNDTEDFNARLKTVFGDRLIPTDDLQYTSSGMGVTATSQQGYIAPIILKVDVK